MKQATIVVRIDPKDKKRLEELSLKRSGVLKRKNISSEVILAIKKHIESNG